MQAMMGCPLKPNLGRKSSILLETNAVTEAKFVKVIDAISEWNIKLFKQVIEEENMSVDFQEPSQGYRSLLHFAVKYNFKDGIRYLLKNGARCNILDSGEISPLHEACRQGFFEICRELLAAGADINLQDKKGKMPLHYACTSIPNETDIDSGRDITKVVQLLLQKGASTFAKDVDSHTALHLAAQVGASDAARLLLSGSGYNLASCKDSKERLALHYAVLGAKSIEIISLLIANYPDGVDAVDSEGQTPLHLVAGRSGACVDEEFDIACLDMLLSRGAKVNIVDKNGSNPLALALYRTLYWGRSSSRDFLLTIVQMLVAKGSSIICCLSMWRMAESFPGLLNQTLCHSIKTNTSIHNSTLLELTFDMRSLVATEKLHETYKAKDQPFISENMVLPKAFQTLTDMSILSHLVSSGNNKILAHPLCRVFLHLKWLKIRKYFAANFVLNCIFVLFVTTYVFIMNDEVLNSVSSMNQALSNMENASSASVSPSLNFNANIYQNRTLNSCAEQFTLSHINYKIVIWITLCVISALMSVREVVQFINSPRVYCTNVKRILTLSILVFLLSLLIHPCSYNEIWWTQIGAGVVIVSWIYLLLSFGQFPDFGVYIMMFSTVASNVLKFLSLYMLLVFAFAFGFHVMMRPYKTFGDLLLSVSTTFVMMTGELDYEAVFIDNGVERVGLLCIVVLLFFIFLVYIILSNLLVGLAVSDMTAIRKRSELMRLKTQVLLIEQFEDIIRARVFPSAVRKYFIHSISLQHLENAPLLTIHPNQKRGWIFELFIDGFIPPTFEPELPKSLLKPAICLAVRQFEMEKRDKLLRRTPVASHHHTVINRMPIPTTAKQLLQTVRGKENVPFNFNDIVEEDSDESDNVEFAYTADSQPLVGRKKFLTLRTSSRGNLVSRSSSQVIGAKWGSYMNNPATDPEEVRQTLLELQMTIDSLEKALPPSTPIVSRRPSTSSHKIRNNDPIV